MKINPSVLWGVGVIVLISGVLTVSRWNFIDRLPEPSSTPTITRTSTATGTPTPPPIKGERGVMISDTECYDWSFHMKTKFVEKDEVYVIGKNQTDDWYMVARSVPEDACWVKVELVRPINFNPQDMFLISEPFPPATATPAPSVTVTGTATSTATRFYGIPFTSTATPTRTPRTKTPTATFTPTGLPPNTSTATPTPTPLPTSLPTHTPTDTPRPTATSTNTPVNTATATNTAIICNALPAPELSVSLQGQNVMLSWSPVEEAVRYEVYKAVNNGGYSRFGSTPGTSMEDSLRPKDTHHYYVVAFSSCGEKSTSQVKDVTR